MKAYYTFTTQTIVAVQCVVKDICPVFIIFAYHYFSLMKHDQLVY